VLRDRRSLRFTMVDGDAIDLQTKLIRTQKEV
jgi:hypothetical protein